MTLDTNIKDLMMTETDSKSTSQTVYKIILDSSSTATCIGPRRVLYCLNLFSSVKGIYRILVRIVSRFLVAARPMIEFKGLTQAPTKILEMSKKEIVYESWLCRLQVSF